MEVKILGPGPENLGLYPIGWYLNKIIHDMDKDGKIFILSGLLTDNGLDLFKDLFQEKLGIINISIILGIDMGIEKVTLIELMKIIPKDKLYLYHNPKDTIFHPKLYVCHINDEKGVIITGSSNFTYSGLINNFEINTSLELDLTDEEEKSIFNNYISIYREILKSSSCIKVNDNIINDLFKEKTIFNEDIFKKYQYSGRQRSDLFDGSYHGWTSSATESFVMTLSYNDVSGRRAGDKYIRIPKISLDKNPVFWGLKGNSEKRVKIVYENIHNERRLYYVERIKEVRLVCPEIYNLGEEYTRSILLINKKDDIYYFELILRLDPRYSTYYKMCVNESPSGGASISKKWGFF